MLPAPCKWRSAKASGSLCVGGLQGGAPVAASWKPFSHGHARLQAEQFRAESGGIRHEAVRGADAERGVVVPGSALSEIDHHVFVQVGLASQIAAKEVKSEREQVLGVLTGAALALAAGTVARGAGVVGKQEDDPVRRFLLSGKPLHRTQLGDLLLLPLVKDNLTSAVILKEFSEVTNGVMETYLSRVNHKNLHGGQQQRRREGSLHLFWGGEKHL